MGVNAMEGLAQRLTRSFLRRGIITADQTEWCAYILECKLDQWFAFAIMAVVGTVLAGLPKTLLFLCGVSFLRRRTNGYHANTYLECLVKSLGCEVVCLLAAPLLPVWACALLLTAGTVTVVLLAPVNNQNLHFDEREMAALRQSTRKRLAVADLAAVLLLAAVPEYAAYLVLALCVVAVLLLLAKLGFGMQ